MNANDSARAAARTMGADQVMIHQWVDTAGAATYWVQSPTAAVANAGTLTTINDTSPTSDRWNAAAVEILVGSVAVSPTVPNVVGLTQASASSAITGAGLVVGGVTTSPSSTGTPPVPVFNGTTHMMMLGTNNLEIADVILNWVDGAVSSKSKKLTARK